MAPSEPGLEWEQASRAYDVPFYEVQPVLDEVLMDPDGHEGLDIIGQGTLYFRDLAAAEAHARAELERLTPRLKVDERGVVPIPRVFLSLGFFEAPSREFRHAHPQGFWQVDGSFESRDYEVEVDAALVAEAERRASS